MNRTWRSETSSRDEVLNMNEFSRKKKQAEISLFRNERACTNDDDWCISQMWNSHLFRYGIHLFWRLLQAIDMLLALCACVCIWACAHYFVVSRVPWRTWRKCNILSDITTLDAIDQHWSLSVRVHARRSNIQQKKKIFFHLKNGKKKKWQQKKCSKAVNRNYCLLIHRRWNTTFELKWIEHRNEERVGIAISIHWNAWRKSKNKNKVQNRATSDERTRNEMKNVATNEANDDDEE